MKLSSVVLLTFSGVFLAGFSGVSQADMPSSSKIKKVQAAVAAKAALGKLIFRDQNLSEPAGQSCHSCHQTEGGYADPGKVVSPGATPVLFGNRNAPSIAYVKFNPSLYWDKSEAHWVGGFFHDGRAKTLQQQADKPFTNPLEMGNSSIAALLEKIKAAPYAQILEQLYGKAIWGSETTAINAVTDAIVAYEIGPEFSLFSSKYDYYLKGEVALTPLEKQGLELFEAEDKGNCAACHPSQPDGDAQPPLFTDFTYDNLGLAKNFKLPFLAMQGNFNPAGKTYIDNGLADNPHIKSRTEQLGKFKVPTLRNVGKTAPYMHNGMFTKLTEVVDFYNTRDTKDRWGKPEVAQNVNNDELGDLKLTKQEVKAIVSFMETLDDGFKL
jgi:cytochrome c peroxidase